MNVRADLYKWQYLTRQWLAGQYSRLKYFPTRGRKEQEGQEPERVLLIATGLIGDTVMSTPVILEARRLWPEAKITLLGRKHNCELLSACPLLDSCIEAPAIPFSIRKRREIAALKERVREERFDLAIILLGDQFALMLAEVGIPVRVGVRGHLLEPCLTHTYDIRSPREWGPAERLNALRCLGYDVRDVRPQLWVSDDARDAVWRKLADWGLTRGEDYALIHPFGSEMRKWWSVDKVGELAVKLRQEWGLRTVLVGGSETRDFVPEHVRVRVIDTTGRLSLQELAAAIDQARVVISTDSGPYHIAGALARPIVGLFPSLRPEHANRYPEARIVFGHDASCQHSCKWDYCQSQHCRQLTAISVVGVVSAVGWVGLRLYAGSGARQ
ncbi:MAG TPA: glycosyltransferase family 9 protein [Blastocatellia bacterium]|nr:glycosyltransferase family 9 protein [Blastocatellia bacterium]